MIRPTTGRTALLRLGFVDTDLALERLRGLGEAADPLLSVFGLAADPDEALAGLTRLVEAAPDAATLLDALADDEGTAMRLLAVLGASPALGDHLVRHPEHWHELTDPLLGSTRPPAYALRESLLRVVGADPHADSPVAGVPDAEAVDALRVEYRRLLLRLVARDLAHDVGVDDVAAELSDLAAGTLEAALAVARQRVGEPADLVRLAVVAMGKCGGHELNYVSDVDVIFVARAGRGRRRRGRAARRDPAGEQPDPDLLRPHRRGHHLAGRRRAAPRGQGRAAGAHAGQPPRLLRAVGQDLGVPGAAQGPPGRRRPGARPAYVEMVAPMVWSAAEREHFVEDTQAMRRRVIDHIPAKEAERQIKLGSGGLRDVEFAVQLLQLVHGRADERIRVPTTLSALAELTRGGYVGREDGEALHEAYAFLRTLEHRIQLRRLQRTHVLPDDEEALRCLGRSLGFMKNPVASFAQVFEHHRREVRRLHEKLFYRPLLSAVALDPGPRGPALARGRGEAAGRARLRRRPRGAAPPRGAHQRGVAARQHPAHAAAGDARLVRRGRRPRRRAVRLPPDQRVARLDPVVPRHAARRGAGRPAPGRGCWPPPATSPRCSSVSPRACGCSPATWCPPAPSR